MDIIIIRHIEEAADSVTEVLVDRPGAEEKWRADKRKELEGSYPDADEEEIDSHLESFVSIYEFGLETPLEDEDDEEDEEEEGRIEQADVKPRKKGEFAQIDLMMEVEVVDENGNGVSSDDAEWEDAQVRCIEDAVDKMQTALYELDFEASVNQEP